jgi:hypothetical protein
MAGTRGGSFGRICLLPLVLALLPPACSNDGDGSEALGGAASDAGGEAGSRGQGGSNPVTTEGGAAGATQVDGGGQAGASSAGATQVDGAGQAGASGSGGESTGGGGEAGDSHCSQKICVPIAEHCLTGHDCPTGRGFCTNYHCSPPLAQGAACGVQVYPQADAYECEVGTSCQSSAGGPKCLPSLPIGAICNDADDPENPPVTVDPGACPAEAPCSLGYQIGDTAWYCIAPNTEDTRLCFYGCAPTSWCDPADSFPGGSGICRPDGGDGEDCYTHDSCLLGLSCGTDSLCQARPAAGQSCSVPLSTAPESNDKIHIDCKSGAYCATDSNCHALPGAGEECAADAIATWLQPLGTLPPTCAEGLRCVGACD